ncbi:MAG: hypothetical protein CL677_02550 [Bdellovibrionaceae bacterium]|nr:hypothetical protein [Pseudobdellovibrionaceae bacterium]|tara:strand:- start:260 stop:883 length:624 start_codon:yes stop_codon:yes gene_type:complete
MSKIALWEPHIESFVHSYSRDFFWICPNFIDDQQVQTLLQKAQTFEEDGEFKLGEIGKGNLKQEVPEIRSDKIRWIEEFSSPYGLLAKNIFDGLLTVARNELYLPGKRFECHFAKYDKGSQYKLHTDRHLNKPGRLLTCVVYLSECTGSSGNLVLFDSEINPIFIRPFPGKLVVFDSALEHKVTVSAEDRWSLTGWVRDDLHSGIRL